MSSLVAIDWITTGLLLAEKQEKEVINLYKEGFELKRIFKRKSKEYESAKIQFEKKEIKEIQLNKINWEVVTAEKKLNDFIYNKLPRREKEIVLIINGLINNLNDKLKLNSKLKHNLTRQKSINKKKGPKNENVRIKTS